MPRPAVTGIQQLINVNNAIMVVSQASAPAATMAPVATRSKVILMNPAASTPSLAGMSPYLSNTVPLGGQQVKPVVDYVANTLHLNAVLIFAHAIKQLRSQGKEVTGESVREGKETTLSPGAS